MGGKLFYLTVNDPPSGVFASQVIDVCHYLRDAFGVRVRLVAFVSVRGFGASKRKIKSRLPDAIVLPSMPKVQNWHWNYFLLWWVTFFLKPTAIFARGPFATNLALELRKAKRIQKVGFDGRGAYSAELQEYEVVVHEGVKRAIKGIEQQAVLGADVRLAVSQQLVRYWQEQFGYKGEQHVIIPCLLAASFQLVLPSEEQLAQVLQELGWSKHDIGLVYAGSIAGWQSGKLMDRLLGLLLQQYPNLKVLLLSRFSLEAWDCYRQFPDRISQRWVTPDEVDQYLAVADYGLLIREKSTTNIVASPTKFAEYLSKGLQILISEDIGDYAELVRQKQLGAVLDHELSQLPTLSKTDAATRANLNQYAAEHFTKSSHHEQYQQLLLHLGMLDQ